jgi:hypothetical protein
MNSHGPSFEEKHFRAPRRFEPWFQRTFPNTAERITAKLVAYNVVFAALGFVGGFLFSTA